MSRDKIIVAVTGASGFQLAFNLLGELKKKKIETHVIVSNAADKVREYETSISKKDIEKLSDFSYKEESIHTRICSGSFDSDGMIVIPCSMKTLGFISNGIDANSIARAAGVQLKSGKKVVLVPRETPMNLAQLRNLVSASEIGCKIVFPMMCHYIKPENVEDMEDYIIGRILEILGVKHEKYRRWDENE